MTNLFKSYDTFSIESNVDFDTVVQRLKKGVILDEKLFNSQFKSNLFVSKPYYGVFSYPNKFVIKPRFGANPKNETEIDIIKAEKTIIDFKVNNMPVKFIIILMSLPFVGLFFYFLLNDSFKIDFLIALIILSFPTIILLVGFLVISASLQGMLKYFKKIIGTY